jgi:radical SAM protein with 4Fe4S-binding SPASM domain
MKITDFMKANAAAFVPLAYPNVHIDTFAYCNAKCVFCGYNTMTRPKGRMSMDLFARIVDDMAAWIYPPQEVSPIHYGELFLNPDWYTILVTLQDRLPSTRIAISTNGSHLTDENFFKLMEIKTLRYINFSVYGFFDETYERVMGLPAANRDRCLQLVRKIRVVRPDIGVCIGTTNNPFICPCESGVFRKVYGVKWPLYSDHPMNANKQINPSLQRDYPYPIPCIEVLACMVVQWNGKVSICCSDPNGELEIGDASKERLLDIWKGPRMREFQRLHLSGLRDEIPLCKTCTSATMPQEDFWRSMESGA